MERLLGAMLLCATMTLLPVSARAITLHGSDEDNSYHYIGKVTHLMGGVNVTSQWLCEDRPGATVWRNLGNSTSLTADYIIYADDSTAGCSSGNCDDVITIIRSSTTVTGDCAATSGTWTALGYGIYYLDIHGDAGNDSVFGGSGDTHAYGDAGDDYVYQYSGIGRAYGGAGNDNLFGNAGSADQLRGDADDDCLQDASNSWSVYDCGVGTDRWYHTNTAAGRMSCENREDWCCGFC